MTAWPAQCGEIGLELTVPCFSVHEYWGLKNQDLRLKSLASFSGNRVLCAFVTYFVILGDADHDFTNL